MYPQMLAVLAEVIVRTSDALEPDPGKRHDFAPVTLHRHMHSDLPLHQDFGRTNVRDVQRKHGHVLSPLHVLELGHLSRLRVLITRFDIFVLVFRLYKRPGCLVVAVQLRKQLFVLIIKVEEVLLRDLARLFQEEAHHRDQLSPRFPSSFSKQDPHPVVVLNKYRMAVDVVVEDRMLLRELVIKQEL